MKTPYQIAKELGVSPQAVYKRLTDEFINRYNNHIQRTPKGKYQFGEVAEQGLKELFNRVEQSIQQPENNQVQQQKISLLNQLNSEIAFLREQNKALFEKLTAKDKQLEDERTHSREQSDKLATLAAQLAELNRNNQLLLSREQSRTNPTLLTDSEPPNQPPNKPIMRPPNEPTIQPHTKPPKQKEKQPQPTQKRFLDIFKKR